MVREHDPTRTDAQRGGGIGEVRDRETMQQALLHTLTGHLCLSTIHANNSYHALSRIINLFPHDARSAVLSDLPTIAGAAAGSRKTSMSSEYSARKRTRSRAL